MIKLDYVGTPRAKCTEHRISITPGLIYAPGKLTIIWKCPVCEIEAKESHADESQAEERQKYILRRLEELNKEQEPLIRAMSPEEARRTPSALRNWRHTGRGQTR